MKFKSQMVALFALALALGNGSASTAAPPIFSLDLNTFQQPNVTLVSSNSTSGNARLDMNYSESPYFYLYKQYAQGAEVTTSWTYSRSCNADFRVRSLTHIDVSARGAGACTFTLKYMFDLKADVISSAERFRNFGSTVTGPTIEIPVSLSFTEAGTADIDTSTNYVTDLGLKCDSLASSAKVNCSASPTAFDRSTGRNLSGVLPVWVCTYKQDAGNRDCRTQIAGSSAYAAVEVNQFEFELGKTTYFSMSNIIFYSGSYLALEVYGGKGYLGSKSWYRAPTEPNYKKLSVSLKTSSDVIWGKTYKFSVSTSPKLSGTCALWRYQDGAPFKVASPKLSNGSASGSLTWLWTAKPSTKTPMSFVAVCTAGNYKGQSGLLVSGYKP